MHRTRNHVRSLFTVAVILGMSTLSPAGAEEQHGTITEAGRPRMSIVVGKKCCRPSRFAADELQQTIRKMSGAVCPIVTDDTDVQIAVIAVGPPSENTMTARLLKQASTNWNLATKVS